MNSLESPEPRSKRARITIGVVYLLGIAAIVGWSLPEAGSARHRAEPAMRMPSGEVPANAGQRPAPVHATRDVRSKVNCEGCGVVESVRRIDKREAIMEWCAIGDTAGMRIPGTPADGGDHDVASLADTLAGVTLGDQRARKVRVTTRHQFVVRFRDGSRRVFDEDTPRALREGERINVIAGASGVNG